MIRAEGAAICKPVVNISGKKWGRYWLEVCVCSTNSHLMVICCGNDWESQPAWQNLSKKSKKRPLYFHVFASKRGHIECEWWLVFCKQSSRTATVCILCDRKYDPEKRLKSGSLFDSHNTRENFLGKKPCQQKSSFTFHGINHKNQH